MSNFHILFMFYSTNVGIWLVFCKEISISQQHSKSCHKVRQMWLLMLVQFPYNLFKIISTVMLVIHIKSISVTTEREKKRKNNQGWKWTFFIRFFSFSKYQERSRADILPCVVSSVPSQICWSRGKVSKRADLWEKISCSRKLLLTNTFFFRKYVYQMLFTKISKFA